MDGNRRRWDARRDRGLHHGRHPPKERRAATGDAARGDLELVDAVVVANTPFGEFARIDVKLHNTGTRRVVLRRATITVERVERLTFCYTQGDLPVSGDYPIVLPTRT